jgi:hypothetical protein
LASPAGGAEPSDLFQASRRRPRGRASTNARRQAVELSVVLTITTARHFSPLSSVRFIGFHSPHQLCQFLWEGRRNNMVECPPQVAPERQRELHWIERCGRPTTHGHTSPREAFPVLIVFRNVPGGAAFHFHDGDWVFSARHASAAPGQARCRRPARARQQVADTSPAQRRPLSLAVSSLLLRLRTDELGRPTIFPQSCR